MKNSTYKMIADSIEDEETVTDELFGNLPAFLPKRREMLIKLLKSQIPRPAIAGAPKSQIPADGLPFIQLSIDDRCNFCDMCSTFCPTGAIEKIKTIDDITITFNISKCVNCYPCYNLCPKNAMSSGDIADINRLIDDGRETLISRGMTECIKCEMPFLDFEGKGVCRRCEKLSRFENGYLTQIKLNNQ
jgi:ferredoxin